MRGPDALATWRPVQGAPRYYVSDTGRVWSTLRGGRMLRPVAQPSGHLRVGIHGRKVYVHRLVYAAHIGPIGPGDVVRHLDHDPKNNRTRNLAVGTHADNRADTVRAGRQARGETHGRAQLTAEDAREIVRLPYSATEIAPWYGVSVAQICRIRRGESWAHATGVGSW